MHPTIITITRTHDPLGGAGAMSVGRGVPRRTTRGWPGLEPRWWEGLAVERDPTRSAPTERALRVQKMLEEEEQQVPEGEVSPAKARSRREVALLWRDDAQPRTSGCR